MGRSHQWTSHQISILMWKPQFLFELHEIFSQFDFIMCLNENRTGNFDQIFFSTFYAAYKKKLDQNAKKVKNLLFEISIYFRDLCIKVHESGFKNFLIMLANHWYQIFLKKSHITRVLTKSIEETLKNCGPKLHILAYLLD